MNRGYVKVAIATTVGLGLLHPTINKRGARLECELVFAEAESTADQH